MLNIVIESLFYLKNKRKKFIIYKDVVILRLLYKVVKFNYKGK